MLNKFRHHHMKACLWGLAVIIIVAFGLSGSSSLLSNKKNNTVAKIQNRKITISDFHHYLKLAKLFLLLNTPEQKITLSDIEDTARDLLLLVWKTKQEKIKVENEEVVQHIRRNFFPNNDFKQESYEKIINYLSQHYNLGLTTRDFEESIRELLAINKLFDRYVDVQIDEEKIRKLYLRDNQKAKISYLVVPYEKLKVAGGISEQEIEDFYSKNKLLFKRNPKIRIRYILVDEGVLEEKTQEFLKISSLNDISDRLSLSIKETDFISMDDPIEGIGWQPEINKIAFSLKLNEVSPFIKTDNGLMLMEKAEEKKEFIPPINEIRAEVKEKIIITKAKKEAEKFAGSILREIQEKNVQNFKKLADSDNIEFKVVDNIGYYGYVEGLGLNKQVSEIIFSLKEGQIYSEYIPLQNGIYIIKLESLTPFDIDHFQKNQEKYRKLIKNSEEIAARVNLLAQFEKEAEFEFYYTR